MIIVINVDQVIISQKDCKMYQVKPKPNKNTCERCGRFGHSEIHVAKTDVNDKKIIDEEEILCWNANFAIV